MFITVRRAILSDAAREQVFKNVKTYRYFCFCLMLILVASVVTIITTFKFSKLTTSLLSQNGVVDCVKLRASGTDRALSIGNISVCRTGKRHQRKL